MNLKRHVCQYLAERLKPAKKDRTRYKLVCVRCGREMIQNYTSGKAPWSSR
jgi:hypothetical protein